MKHDVIIIHADQHRQDCLGAYGNPEIKTPHMDRLAADGVLFGNHYCPYPVCTPSRYSLLTGVYASVHRGLSNHCTLPAGMPTFAKALRAAGYRTAAVGKMHFTPTHLDAGFDTLVLAEQDGPGRFDDDYHRFLREQNTLDGIDLYDQRREYRVNAPKAYFDCFGAQPSDLPLELHSTTYITEKALEQMDRFQPDGGNLLMAGYIKPHHPFDPPEPYASLYDPKSLALLPGHTAAVADEDKGWGYFDNEKLDPDRLRVVMAMYYGTLTHIDDGVGRIIQKLKDQGRYDNALVIYTSDHGDYLGYRHLLLKGGPMYEPLARIPLIIKYPASWKKTGRDDNLSSNIDVARTILSVCGAAHPPSMQGFDLTQDERRRVVVCENTRSFSNRSQNSHMVRGKTHKLLLSPGPDGCRLFDLANDPLETRDLARDPASKGIIAELKELLLEEMLTNGNSHPHTDVNAPVVNGKTPRQIDREREAMIAYMMEKSSVKPL